MALITTQLSPTTDSGDGCLVYTSGDVGPLDAIAASSYQWWLNTGAAHIGRFTVRNLGSTTLTYYLNAPDTNAQVDAQVIATGTLAAGAIYSWAGDVPYRFMGVAITDAVGGGTVRIVASFK